jgi:hypothetical protein
MLGISFSDAMRAEPSTTPAGAPSPASGAAILKGTMIGVAVPGIAPVSAHVDAPRHPLQGTMMGVAVPGIAPLAGPSASSAGVPTFASAEPRRAVAIAPRPPPLVDEEPDVGPLPRRSRRGVPLGWVAGIVAILVVIAGGVAFLLLRAHPLIAQPRLDAQGREELLLTCESCEDGTVAELYGVRATFKNKQADVPVANPLKVGNNPLTIAIDRPNLGRDESVRVVVPVAFRIRADLGELASARPTISVRVEALPGTVVGIDGKPVPLDGNGDGTYSVDLREETEGPADELRMIDRMIPYTVMPSAGERQAGKLAVRVGIAPLHLDAPGMHAVVDGTTFRIAGRTVRGGSATANGTALHVEADGTFSQPFDIPAVGDLAVEVRVSAPQLASRRAPFVIKRVDHLDDEARVRERAPGATYDALVADLKTSIGKETIVEGDVVEARTTSTQTVGVVDDTRGCRSPPCLVRVTYGGDTRFKHGDVVRVYGRITRPFAYGSSTVPEVEADFVQLGHLTKR